MSIPILAVGLVGQHPRWFGRNGRGDRRWTDWRQGSQQRWDVIQALSTKIMVQAILAIAFAEAIVFYACSL